MSSFFTDDTGAEVALGAGGDASVPEVGAPQDSPAPGGSLPAINLVVIDPDDVARDRLTAQLGSDGQTHDPTTNHQEIGRPRRHQSAASSMVLTNGSEFCCRTRPLTNHMRHPTVPAVHRDSSNSLLESATVSRSYSADSTVSGSSFPARRAGPYPAHRATARSIVATMA